MQNEMQKMADNTVNILGVKVSSTSISSVLTKIDKICANPRLKQPFFITTVNPEFIMLAQDDPEFKKILNSADLAIADGVGLRLAKLNIKIIPGRTLVQKLCEMSKFKIFYLGGKNGVAEAMTRKYGGASDSGHDDIKSQIQNSKSQINLKIINKINNYKPDILFVAYGAPYQEKWLYANRYSLNAKVIMGVGGAFDYLTERSKLPPEWVNKAGLEWLWRLVHEPWRWKRQLNLVRFVFLQTFLSRR